MGVLSDLQKLRDEVKTESVFVGSINKDVQLMRMFMSHRFILLEETRSSRDFSLALVALSLYEDGQRLCDSFDLDELIAFIDPLPDEDFNNLFEVANRLSKTTEGDLEDAEKK